MAEGGGLLNRCRASSLTVSSNLIPSASFLSSPTLRPGRYHREAQVSWGFPSGPVDRQERNDRRKWLSEGRFSPNLWTGVISYQDKFSVFSIT